MHSRWLQVGALKKSAQMQHTSHNQSIQFRSRVNYFLAQLQLVSWVDFSYTAAVSRCVE